MEQIITQNQNLDYKLSFEDKNFRFLNSGKLGLNLILDYLKTFKNFNPKYDEVFVPKYMGQWIYSSLNQKCITSPVFTNDTKVIYMYHQFGIPQNIDYIKNFALEKKIILLEDCAHIIGGNCNKQNFIGKIGDFTIFSFSKFVDCYLLGGVNSNNDNFINYVDETIIKSSKFQSYLNYIILRLAYLFNEKNQFRKKLFNLNYSLYNFPSKYLDFVRKDFYKKIYQEINLRLKRYNQLKNEFSKNEKMDFLKYDNLILFKFPLIVTEKEKKNLQKVFNNKNIYFELMQYDLNRNMLNPNYKEVIVIEIGSKNRNFDIQLELIKKEING